MVHPDTLRCRRPLSCACADARLTANSPAKSLTRCPTKPPWRSTRVLHCLTVLFHLIRFNTVATSVALVNGHRCPTQWLHSLKFAPHPQFLHPDFTSLYFLTGVERIFSPDLDFPS